MIEIPGRQNIELEVIDADTAQAVNLTLQSASGNAKQFVIGGRSKRLAVATELACAMLANASVKLTDEEIAGSAVRITDILIGHCAARQPQNGRPRIAH